MQVELSESVADNIKLENPFSFSGCNLKAWNAFSQI